MPHVATTSTPLILVEQLFLLKLLTDALNFSYMLDHTYFALFLTVLCLFLEALDGEEVGEDIHASWRC